MTASLWKKEKRKRSKAKDDGQTYRLVRCFPRDRRQLIHPFDNGQNIANVVLLHLPQLGELDKVVRHLRDSALVLGRFHLGFARKSDFVVVVDVGELLLGNVDARLRNKEDLIGSEGSPRYESKRTELLNSKTKRKARNSRERSTRNREGSTE